jgi:hypothetical protein
MLLISGQGPDVTQNHRAVSVRGKLQVGIDPKIVQRLWEVGTKCPQVGCCRLIGPYQQDVRVKRPNNVAQAARRPAVRIPEASCRFGSAPTCRFRPRRGQQRRHLTLLLFRLTGAR